LDQRRDRIDRGADRQVDDAVRMRSGQRFGVDQGVPRELRQGRRDGPAQSPSPCGGRSLTTCGSFSVIPTLAAPPGDPSSTKKSALICVYWLHWSGTSSS